MTKSIKVATVSQKVNQTVQGIFRNSMRSSNQNPVKVEPSNAMLVQQSEQSQHPRSQSQSQHHEKMFDKREGTPAPDNLPTNPSAPRLFLRHQRSRISPAIRRASEQQAVHARAHSNTRDNNHAPLEALVHEAVESLKTFRSTKFIPNVPADADEQVVLSMYNICLRFNLNSEGIQSLNIPLHGLIQEYQQCKFKDTNLALSVIIICLITGVIVFDLCGLFVIHRMSSSASSSTSSSTSVYADIAGIDIAAVVAGVAAVALLVVSFTHRVLYNREQRIRAANRPRSSHHQSQTPSTSPPEMSSPTHRLRRRCLPLDPSSTAVRAINDMLVVFLTFFAGLATL